MFQFVFKLKQDTTISIITTWNIMRPPVVVIQCWWRTVLARHLYHIEKELQDQEIIEYWRYRGINDAPQYAQDLFAEMATPRR